MKRRKINKKLTKWLEENAINYNCEELAKLVNDKFKENYSSRSIRQYCVRNRIKYKYMNKNLSRKPSNYLPIGTERIKSDGMIMVKIASNKWEYKQRVIYEKYHGEIPKDMFVIFLDGNRNNFNIDNLKAITRKTSSLMANYKLFSKDKDVNETGIILSNLIIETREKERLL